MPIKIVNDYIVAIRPVELEDIATILCVNKVNPGTKEYKIIMGYLSSTGVSLTELLDYDTKYYEQLKKELVAECEVNPKV